MGRVMGRTKPARFNIGDITDERARARTEQLAVMDSKTTGRATMIAPAGSATDIPRGFQILLEMRVRTKVRPT